jgi:hypothetical protein
MELTGAATAMLKEDPLPAPAIGAEEDEADEYTLM